MIDNPYMLHEFLIRNSVSLTDLRSKNEKFSIAVQDLIRAFKLKYKMVEDGFYYYNPRTLIEHVTLIDRHYYAEFHTKIKSETMIRSDEHDIEFLMNSIKDIDEINDDLNQSMYLELKNLDIILLLPKYLPKILWLKLKMQLHGALEKACFQEHQKSLISEMKKEGIDLVSFNI